MDRGLSAPLGNFRLGGWLVRPSLDRVERDGSTARLEPLHMDVLVFLARHPGEVLSRDEILSGVWGEKIVADAVLSRAVGELRKALGDDAQEPRYIETIPRRGYRLVAPVRLEADGEPKRRSRSKWLLPALLLVGAVAGVLLVIARTTPGSSSGAPERPLIRRQITTSPHAEIAPSFSPTGHSLAVSSNRTGSFEIWVEPLTPGARPYQVTNDGRVNLHPAWSPRDRWIAYHSVLDGGIWLVPAQGGARRQLVDFGSRPAWSPDGTRLVFQSSSPPGVIDNSAVPPSTIWMIEVADGAVRPLTRPGEPPGGHHSPAFSADGDRIVFRDSFGMGVGVWTVSADGDDLRRVRGTAWLRCARFASDSGSFLGIAPAQGEEFLVRVTPSGPDERPNIERLLLLGDAIDLAPADDDSRFAYSGALPRSNLWAISLDPTSGVPVAGPEPLIDQTNVRNSVPSFSPDGRRIAFQRFRHGHPSQLWLIEHDGTDLRDLTDGDVGAVWPVWSADGRWVFFRSRGKWNRIDVSSRRVEVLADRIEPDWIRPTLSPDSLRVAYSRTTGGTTDMWTAARDGSDPTRLTFAAEFAGFPSWSPDGERLAFELVGRDSTQLAMVPAAGGDVELLTREPGLSWTGGWSPDGRKIAFAARRGATWNVYWIDIESRTVQQVTDFESDFSAFVRYPVWSPRGDQIVFERHELTADIWLAERR